MIGGGRKPSLGLGPEDREGKFWEDVAGLICIGVSVAIGWGILWLSFGN